MGVMLILTLGLVAAYPGSIKTTTSPCNAVVNENHYTQGEIIYIHGSNFNPGDYNWDIIGQPGSCDSSSSVASGSINVDNSGSFCFNTSYIVQSDDCGVYKANIGTKQDPYTIESINVPEFGTTIGIATALGALGVFFLVRRK